MLAEICSRLHGNISSSPKEKLFCIIATSLRANSVARITELRMHIRSAIQVVSLESQPIQPMQQVPVQDTEYQMVRPITIPDAAISARGRDFRYLALSLICDGGLQLHH
jgi:hypothetical protein